MTDRYTDELFALPASEAVSVRFPVSRLVVDPERFLDDAREPMASRGMGVIYTHMSDRTPLRDPPSRLERDALIEAYYEPHHAALTRAVRSALEVHGDCLIVDCHSFASRPLPYELDQSPDRPDICIGTDAFHTPEWLRQQAEELFAAGGRSVEIDRPFSGALVPAEFYGRSPHVHALMLEVNRRLYLDEATGEKLAAFPEVAASIQGILRKILHDCRS